MHNLLGFWFQSPPPPSPLSKTLGRAPSPCDRCNTGAAECVLKGLRQTKTKNRNAARISSTASTPCAAPLTSDRQTVRRQGERGMQMLFFFASHSLQSQLASPPPLPPQTRKQCVILEVSPPPRASLFRIIKGRAPKPPCPPSPDQIDHRGKKRNLQQGTSGQAIFGAQSFGSQPPPPLCSKECPAPTPHPSFLHLSLPLKTLTVPCMALESKWHFLLGRICVGHVLHPPLAPANANEVRWLTCCLTSTQFESRMGHK